MNSKKKLNGLLRKAEKEILHLRLGNEFRGAHENYAPSEANLVDGVEIELDTTTTKMKKIFNILAEGYDEYEGWIHKGEPFIKHYASFLKKQEDKYKHSEEPIMDIIYTRTCEGLDTRLQKVFNKTEKENPFIFTSSHYFKKAAKMMHRASAKDETITIRYNAGFDTEGNHIKAGSLSITKEGNEFIYKGPIYDYHYVITFKELPTQKIEKVLLTNKPYDKIAAFIQKKIPKMK